MLVHEVVQTRKCKRRTFFRVIRVVRVGKPVTGRVYEHLVRCVCASKHLRNRSVVSGRRDADDVVFLAEVCLHRCSKSDEFVSVVSGDAVEGCRGADLGTVDGGFERQSTAHAEPRHADLSNTSQQHRVVIVNVTTSLEWMLWINEWMNERTNERTNEWMNEWTNKLMNEW